MLRNDSSASVGSALLFFAIGYVLSRLFSMDRTRLDREAHLKAQLEWRERAELRRQSRQTGQNLY